MAFIATQSIQEAPNTFQLIIVLLVQLTPQEEGMTFVRQILRPKKLRGHARSEAVYEQIRETISYLDADMSVLADHYNFRDPGSTLTHCEGSPKPFETR